MKKIVRGRRSQADRTQPTLTIGPVALPPYNTAFGVQAGWISRRDDPARAC
jgi:hypothetical protein